MTGCKHTHWKLLGAFAALACLLPRMAAGEIGVCPPYSQTFGPGDPPENIVAFMNSASTRPGGATVKLLPGDYVLEGLAEITGVLCIEGLVDEGGSTVTILEPQTRVGAGGTLTARSVAIDRLTVGSDAMLFAHDFGRIDYSSDIGYPKGRLTIEAGAFAQVLALELEQVGNQGTLLLAQGRVSGRGLFNAGFAVLDQVVVHDEDTGLEEAYATAIYNTGVITLIRSTIYGDACSYEYAEAIGIENVGGTAYAVGSSIAWSSCCHDPSCDAIGIVNEGGTVEVARSIVADNGSEDCSGVVEDKGYNVFGPDGGCTVTDPTSIAEDPLLVGYENFELGAGSPAIDLIPIDLCEEVDGLGRARTDGDGDGMVECDAGALEYGYVGLQVDVRTTPYWKTVGMVDLSTENTLFVAVFSDAHVDATTIDFDSIYVEGFDARVRGPAYGDKNRDGLPDLVFWYRLDRDLDLECGDYDQHFEALTGDGQIVVGQLRLEATGCSQ